MNTARETEQHRYIELYKHGYGMTRDRLDAIKAGIITLNRSEYFQNAVDIGAGRGEVVSFLNKFICEATGTEVVPDLCKNETIRAEIHDLRFKDNSRDLVTCLDVLEHILPEDTDKAISELTRVSSNIVFVSVNNQPSKTPGGDLHINKRPYQEWRDLLSQYGTVSEFHRHTISKYYSLKLN